MEQLRELLSGHNKVLASARAALDKAIEENKKSTDQLKTLIKEKGNQPPNGASNGEHG